MERSSATISLLEYEVEKNRVLVEGLERRLDEREREHKADALAMEQEARKWVRIRVRIQRLRLGVGLFFRVPILRFERVGFRVRSACLLLIQSPFFARISI